MNYELAKELKDAGFPQNTDGKRPMNEIIVQDDREGLVPGRYYVPLLEELIEACVGLSTDGDFHLEHFDHVEEGGRWAASVCWKQEEPGWFIGETADEAVARLWLALNKK